MPIDPGGQTLRLALGTALAFGVGQMFGWRLAFIVPILAVTLLKSPRPLTIRQGLGFFLVIAGTFAFALLLILPLLNYPLAAMIFLTLSLFWIFYIGQRGQSPFVVMMLLLAATLVPVLGLETVELSFEVASGLARSGLLAVCFTWLAFALVPVASAPDEPKAALPRNAPPSDGAGELRSAWASTLVVSPLLLASLVFGLTDYVLVLVFVTLLSVQPDLTRGIAGGLGLVAGNLLGGAIAIVIYELLTVLPNLLFLSLLVALVCIALGRRMLAGGTVGAICGTALTTVLLIIGMTVAPIGPEADAKFLNRIVQVVAAAVYIAAAFVLIDPMINRRAAAGNRLNRAGAFPLQ